LLFCAVAFSVLFASNAAVAVDKNYLDWVGDSITAVEEGRNTDAISGVRQALGCNANDALARTVLGTALLFGGRADYAKKEFLAAAQLDPDCAEAAYGLGLVALVKPDFSEAARYFCQARQARPDLEIEGAIGYVKSLAGGEFEPAAAQPDDESLQALHAMRLMKARQWADALAVWKVLQAKAARAGFGERLGCSMTFVRSAPAVVTGWSVGKSYRPPNVAQSTLPTLAGNVSLKADLARARNVHIVSFFVDGRFVGMTNTQPFNYIWDTTAAPNGVHVVKIEGTDILGDVVSAKSTNVLVQNKGANTPSAHVVGDRASAEWRRLWAMMVLKPSASAINYNLAVCAQQMHETETEKAALERVLAANPTYMDAAQRLIKLRKPSGNDERLYKGDGKRKVIALSFDDGPKYDAGRILDILKAKGVRATFFVVGKQASAFPELVKRMADEGHEIGDHTYNHLDLEYLSETEITHEIFRTAATVRALTGREIHFLRPPGGHTGKQLPEVMRRFGLTTVYWSSNCSRYEGTTTKKLLDYAVSSARPGGIILLHNLELVTVQALPGLIDALRSKGYGFVTLSEMKPTADLTANN
jgi:peptidoglycan/xylan/chitin deacetylase (PgdA/CDA1 family)